MQRGRDRTRNNAVELYEISSVDPNEKTLNGWSNQLRSLTFISISDESLERRCLVRELSRRVSDTWEFKAPDS